MNQNELKDRYYELYEYMSESKDPKNMKLFGKVMCEMMDWMISNKPDAASMWIDKLSAVMWDNYLAPEEADAIVSGMEPEAPWNRDQWKAAMEQHGYEFEEEPYYNRCALYTTMNMIMSDSSETIGNYVEGDKLFAFVHDLAVDKLRDADGKFSIRNYFSV